VVKRLTRGDLVRPKHLKAQYRVREIGGNKVTVFRGSRQYLCQPCDLVRILTLPGYSSTA